MGTLMYKQDLGVWLGQREGAEVPCEMLTATNILELVDCHLFQKVVLLHSSGIQSGS